ncbi:hypothetical protein NPIL_177101 [Nephila pilipes]|uniref:Uncharacterized protein n=1 Tax=Nephila pilipes TaxID=299642 RepID=A0A8X6MSD7_NEPPI|nr:hypothetical protein NPIL_177101 [Nephila pilipes]
MIVNIRNYRERAASHFVTPEGHREPQCLYLTLLDSSQRSPFAKFLPLVGGKRRVDSPNRATTIYACLIAISSKKRSRIFPERRFLFLVLGYCSHGLK